MIEFSSKEDILKSRKTREDKNGHRDSNAG